MFFDICVASTQNSATKLSPTYHPPLEYFPLFHRLKLTPKPPFLTQDLRYNIWVGSAEHSWAVGAHSLLCVPALPLPQMRVCNMVDYRQENVHVFISYTRFLYNVSQLQRYHV